jgi:hypothetical protein
MAPRCWFAARPSRSSATSPPANAITRHELSAAEGLARKSVLWTAAAVAVLSIGLAALQPATA